MQTTYPDEALGRVVGEDVIDDNHSARRTPPFQVHEVPQRVAPTTTSSTVTRSRPSTNAGVT